MPDTVEPAGQDVEQEPADELVGGKPHHALPVGSVPAIVLEAHGDASLAERDQPAVRYGDAVGIAREVGEHGLWPGERRLGVDHPALFPDRGQIPQEGPPLREVATKGDEAGVARWRRIAAAYDQLRCGSPQ